MRVLVAARLSQLADGQTGLDTQDAESTAYALAAGHEVIHVAADRKSGTSAPWERPELRPWVTDPGKLAQYDAVLAYRLDRLSRGDKQSTNAIERWAHEHGKQLLTVDGLRFPCEGADGIRWDVTARIAHDEWLKTSERYRRMQSWLKAEGKLVGRPAFGYAVVPAAGGHKTLAPTDAGRTYVPEIFRRVVDGESLASIARWLDAEGVRPVSGASWWARSLGTMIRNPVYAGRRQDAAGRTILSVEPLVDATTFRLAGEALDGRPKRGPADADNRAMLAGVLTCPRCGDSPMYRIRAGNRKAPSYWYRCSGRGSQRKGCGNMVSLAAADALVSQWAANFDGPVLETVLVPGHNHDAEIDAIKLDIRSLDMDADDYDGRHAELRTELSRLKAEPTVPDRTVTRPTGQTYAGQWSALDPAGRGAWLRSHGIKVFAAKAGAGLCEDAFPALLMGAMGAAWSDSREGVSVIVTWVGAGIDHDD